MRRIIISILAILFVLIARTQEIEIHKVTYKGIIEAGIGASYNPNNKYLEYADPGKYGHITWNEI